MKHHVKPIALSAIQTWVRANSRGKKPHELDTDWDAKAALDHFEIPLLYFANWRDTPEDQVPYGLLEKSGDHIDHVFHPENNTFVFVMHGGQRFLVVDGGGGDGVPFMIAPAYYFDFAS